MSRRLAVLYAAGGLLLALSPGVQGTAYFVDSVSGADENDGRSPLTAWRTVGRVTRSVFAPGDEILFRRGQVWRDTLVVAQSGREGSPITYGAYGNGQRPVISGADIFGGHLWSPAGGAVWSKPGHLEFPSDFVADPRAINKFVVSVDGARFLPVTSLGELTHNTYTFDHTTNTMYIYLEGDARDHRIESAARDAIVIRAQHHVLLQGIEIANSFQNNILIADGSRHIVLQDIVSHHAGTRGILIAGRSEVEWTEFITIENSLFYNHGIIGDTAANDIGCGGSVRRVTVRDCVMYGDGEYWGVDGFLTDTVHGAGNLIEGNLIFNHSENEIDLKEHWESSEKEGRTVIRGNVLYGSGGAVVGLHMGTRDVDILCNHIHSGSFHGIGTYNHGGLSQYDGQEGDVLIAHNFIHNNAHAGISDRGRQGLYRTAGGNRVYNNTIALNGAPGIAFNSPAWDIRNNLLYKNNLNASGQNGTLTQVYIGWKDALSGLTLDWNILTGPDGGTDGELYYYAGSHRTLTWLRENTVHAQHSLVADPAFVGPEEGDFRLQPSSVAIDAGTDVGIAMDGERNCILAGTIPDIGAYEFVEAGTGPE